MSDVRSFVDYDFRWIERKVALLVKPRLGSFLSKVLADMMTLSVHSGMRVEVNFNGVDFVVDEDTNLEALEDFYVAELKRRLVKQESARPLDEQQNKEGEETMKKALDVKDMNDAQKKIPDMEVVGNPGAWVLVCKASSKSQGWMKSTKAMEVGNGLVIQVTTQQGDRIAEALTFVPGASLAELLPKQG